MDLTKRNYIRLNFERALHDGHIHVHYRPILRTLTKKICGVEALSRWHDPLYGTISPYEFIPVLEDIGKIYLLDHFVLTTAARHQHERMIRNLPRIPVSVNLSRCDFTQMDPCYILNESADKYHLPHDYFHIEITETALAQDETVIAKAIRSFRSYGYHVILDNFGSGYASLIALQRYTIDELSIDRVFFLNFSAESRQIIQMILFMSKSLGIHTIAEGVQTEEQVNFLKETGCEKILGDYCSCHMPDDDTQNLLLNENLNIETPAMAQVFRKAGLMNFITETPVGILADNGHDLKLLAANPAYQKELHTVGLNSYNATNNHMQALPQILQEKLRTLADRAMHTRQTERILCVGEGQYFHFSLQTLAGTHNFCLHRAEIKNLNPDENRAATTHYDEIVRHILQLYDELYCLDRCRNSIEVIKSDSLALQPGSHRHGIMRIFLDYADQYIYEADRERFLTFTRQLCPENKSFVQSDHSLIDLFRLRQKNGSYSWKVFDIIPFQDNGHPGHLLCLHDFVLEKQKYQSDVLNSVISSYGFINSSFQKTKDLSDSHLWQALLNFSSRKLFWKNRQGKFCGASRAFLKFYGIKNINTILGKTNEDIGWHIHENTMHEYEKTVIETGQPIHDIPGHCIVRGRQHAISFSKYPVYNGLQVVGLLGEFRDSEEKDPALYQKLYITDEETGFYNYRGMILASVEYADNYRLLGEDYTGIMLSVPEYDRFAQLYGKKAEKELLSWLRNKLLENLPGNIIAAHTGSGIFVCFQKGLDTGVLRQCTERIQKEIADINSIGGFPCTLSSRYALAKGSEARTSDEFLHILSARCLASLPSFGLSGSFGDTILLDREALDHAEEMVYINDPLTYDLVYMNASLLKSLHLPENFYYIGYKCYEILAGEQRPCADCPQAKLQRSRFLYRLYHNPWNSMDVRRNDILVPWNCRDYHFCSSINLEDMTQKYHKQYAHLTQAFSLNDALNLAIREEDPDRGIQKMISKIGTMLKADHILIIEEETNGFFLNSTYEWHPQGIKGIRPLLQHLPIIEVKTLYDVFRNEQTVLIKDMDVYLRTHPSSLFQTQAITPKVHAFAAGQLVMGDHPLGSIIILNPEKEYLHMIPMLLETLTRFCSILLRNRDTMKRLHELSTIDPLTGAGNRHALDVYLKAEMKKGESYVIIFSDINGLKKTNDTLGHNAGDHLIQALSAVLIDIGGRKNVFRLGGDEFLMILPCRTGEKAHDLLQQIEQKLQAQHVSAALGYAICQAPLQHIDDMIHEADKRMYSDKKNKHLQRE